MNFERLNVDIKKYSVYISVIGCSCNYYISNNLLYLLHFILLYVLTLYIYNHISKCYFTNLFRMFYYNKYKLVHIQLAYKLAYFVVIIVDNVQKHAYYYCNSLKYLILYIYIILLYNMGIKYKLVYTHTSYINGIRYILNIIYIYL